MAGGLNRLEVYGKCPVLPITALTDIGRGKDDGSRGKSWNEQAGSQHTQGLSGYFMCATVCLFVFNYGLTCQLLTFSGPGAGCAGSLGRDGYVLPRSRQFAAFLSIFWHLQSLSSFYAVCSERRWYESLVYSCARTHHSFSASMQCTHQSLCLLPLTGKRCFSSQG